MMQFLCVDPIIAKPSAFAETIESGQFQDQQSYSEVDKTEFQQAIGASYWQIWIQEGPCDEHFCIQYIKCQDPTELFFTFKSQVAQQNRYALWLHHVFQTYLSFEYSLMQPVLKIEQVLHLPIDPHSKSQGYDFCYMLPLLPDMIEAHKEYCRLAMNEKREATLMACKAFGMIELTKWIQESKNRNYVLYFQKMQQTIENSRQSFLALKDVPKALQATQTLREQTGVSFEELCPQVKVSHLLVQFKEGLQS